MNVNRFWNPNPRGHCGRGGFNRGGRGFNRGWSWRGGFNMPPNPSNRGFGRGHRFKHPPKQWENRPLNHRSKDSPGKRLSEDLIGVTEYISTHEGFNGIIKSRYSDFQVSEMNEKGEIAKLTTTKPPVKPTDEAIDDDEDLLLNKYNLEILPMETWDKINSLTVNTVAKGAEIPKVEIDMEGVTKEQRTKIHDAVKKAFGDSIVGSTVNVGDKKFMRFEKYRKGVRIDTRVKWVWPGEYVYFIVHKENCDTIDAAARIAERIGVNFRPSMIGYAGTKDRRAKTSQWFSVKRVDPARLAAACRQLRDVRVGNYSFGNDALKLGMLKGNKFRIALRNVTADEEIVDAACQDLKEHGFINYYGLQRFGTRIDTPTFDIGLKLLQAKYKEAIDAILEPRAGPLQAALLMYRARGAADAALLLPYGSRAHSAHSEARLLIALADHPHDLVGALNRLARNIRLLYLHSYQSLVWNRAVSERIRRFGLQPAVGDCVPLPNVVIKDSIQDGSESEDEGGESDVTNSASDVASTASDDNPDSDDKLPASDSAPTDASDTAPIDASDTAPIDASDTSATTDDSNTKTSPKQKQKSKKKSKGPDPKKPPLPIKFLTQEDVDSGKYNIFNIVMPLPGACVAYPPNMIDFYKDTLTKDGLKMDLKHKLRSYSMTGAYRHMAVRPLGVTWRHVRYSDPFADLVASDADEMDGRQITGIVEEDNREQNSDVDRDVHSDDDLVDDSDGKYKALLLNMILPSSCYATMALRELLKTDTSCDNQALQNDYHKKDEKEEVTSTSTADTETSTKAADENIQEAETLEKDISQNTAEENTDAEVTAETEELNSNGEEEDAENTGEKRKLKNESEDSVKKLKTNE